MELKDKVVVVTGAGQGLGRQFALTCAENGMKVALGDINMETLEKPRSECDKKGNEAKRYKLDVTKDIFEEKNIFGDEISKSFKIIENKGSGAIVLINTDMAPNIDKIFNRRDSEDDKLELREYGVGAQILLELGLHKIILLSNSNKKIIALDGFDLEIVSQEKI